MKKVFLASALALLAALGSGCNPAHRTPPSTDGEKPQELAPDEARRLEAIGTTVFGVEWHGKVAGASARGFEVVTDGTTTLSHRPAGNAWFVQNPKLRTAGGPGFRGSDDQLIGRGRSILDGLKIDAKEIAAPKVLQELVQTGKLDRATRRLRAGKPQTDRRTLLVTRAFGGIPVWSSRLLMDLDRAGRVASLEISWPTIAPKTFEAATRLQRLVAGAYRPPELRGAKVESVEAGILHSSAASFVDEQVAAIRVIYAPTERRFGMKPVYYFDADGRAVPIPRQMVARPEEPTPARTQKAR